MGRAPVLFAAVLLSPSTVLAERSWVEARSSHFRVLSDAGEKNARRVATELETIRDLYQSIIGARLESGDAVVIFAAKDQDSFEALLPPHSRKDGGSRWAGVFLEVPFGYTIVLRLDVQGEHRFRTVYHEYFHFLARKNLGGLPPWLNEGLAEYWDTIDVREKEVLVGRPDDRHIALLRDKTLLPLETLFAADHSSPHYRQEEKMALFYAQSWALIHFLQSDPERREQLSSYVSLLGEGAERVEAARQAFGDLGTLREALGRYVRNYRFQGVRITRAPSPEEDRLTPRSLPDAETLAVRGAHLVRIGDPEEGESLLSQAIRKDPSLAEAHESLGLLHRFQGERERSRQSFEEAVRLDSGRYLSQFLLAEALAQGEASSRSAAEEHYMKVLSLNRDFAPVYHSLAWFYFAQDEKPTRSANLSRQAVTIEPHTASYRLVWAFFLRELGESGPGEREAKEAVNLAMAAEGPYLANNVCWFGSLYGFASIALDACEAAVTRGPESASFRDSRGLARALTGDLTGAIEDFRFFVDYVGEDRGERKKTRSDWIASLEKGENPFDEATLRALRANP